MNTTWIKNNTDLTKQISPDFWSDPAAYIQSYAMPIKKSGYHRNVFSFTIDDSNKKILVKHFVASTFIEKLKWYLGKSPAKKEWVILNHLSNNNVLTPTPLAFGSQKGDSLINSWIAVEFIDNAVTFDNIRPPKSIKKTLYAARQLAETIAKVHFAAVHHGDLHSGNLLYIPPQIPPALNPKSGKWLITDFQRSKLNCFSRSNFVSDLVQLNHCLGKKVPLGVRAVFIKTYLQKFDELTDNNNEVADWEWKNLLFEIGKKSRLYSIYQAKSRNKRCLSSNKNFMAVNDFIPDNNYLHIFENAWLYRGASKQLINDLINLLSDANWFLNANVTIIKNRPSVAVGMWSHPQGNLFIKQYRYRNSLREKIMAHFHKSKSHRNWKACWRLRNLHINTPKPLLVAWTSRGGIIAWESLSNAITSESALLRFSTPNLKKQKLKIIREIAAQIALLHNSGTEHGDLKSSNLLILNIDEKNPRAFFTDLDAAKFYNFIPWPRRIRDLARLYAALYPFVSNPEIRYFMRIYLKKQNEIIDVRQLIVSVRDRAEKKIIQKGMKS
ncbi:MAG: hypothetical protein DRI44_07225 [Chlamydiae bacterium]|nr:MAG: hypothetical protein DRI44_07225 [Chlamydiota bacterium]